MFRFMPSTCCAAENHRFQTEFEDSLITKTCLFQFVNAYFSLFYIAFIKNNVDLFGKPQQCTPNASNGEPDCLGELAVQLGIILVTKIVMGNIMEFGLPFIKIQFKRLFGVRRRKCS